VTGVLFVELDYHPNTPLTLMGSWDGTPEIPTLPTQIEQAQTAVKAIIQKLDEINFKGLIEELTNAASSISEFANSPDLRRTIQSLDQTLASIRDLSSSVEKSVTPLTQSLRLTATQVTAMSRELEQTLGTARNLIAPEAPLAVDLRQAVDEIRNAARAVTALADELDRNPSSIVFGRDTKKGKEEYVADRSTAEQSTRRARVRALAAMAAVGVVASGSLVGCAFFAPRPDPSRFYVLTSTAEPGTSHARAASASVL
jgi:paraquat-inducible protein B